MAAFEEMGVLPEIAKAVEEMDWMLPMDVQAEAIPLILGGGDVLMAAETGSGKTGAFCLPIIQIVWETLKDLEAGKGSRIIAQTSPHWTLSFFDRGSALAVTPDGLRCQSREQKEWHGCRATKGVQGKGRFFYEATVTDEGLCRVGWSTAQASLDIGTDRFGFGFGGTGKKSTNKQFDSYGEAFGMHDVIGCFLDLDNGEIKFSKNGVDLGRAFSIPPQIKMQAFFPSVVLKNAEMLFNYGAQPFKYPPEKGWLALCEAPKETVKQNDIGNSGAAVQSKPIKNAPQAIIIEPSRELAEQTYSQIIKFKTHLENPKVRELLVIGGVNVKDQISELNSGVDLVVGTPGRMEDLISAGHLSLTQCRFFVLDEADGLLKQGYTDLIDRLHRQIPKITSDGRRLQMIVCSATLHAFEVKKMAERLMHFPTWVDLKGEDAVPETVHHVVVMVDPQKDNSWQSLRRHIQTDCVHAKDNVRPGNNTAETLSEAVKMLKGEYCVRAINEHKMDRAIIFCRTKIDCDNLERYLNQVGGGAHNRNNPYSCVCLHGDRKPAERKGNLEKFKKQESKFLICTDVAARGLDIAGLPFMVNITLPDEKSNYVHRIGRVGRAERMGLAISLVSTVPEKVWYHGEWCSSRGRNCWNTRLTDESGCCIWYNEPRVKLYGGGAHNRNNPYSCVCLHGDRKPAERKGNLEKFKKQESKFLICTDVAARGLDIAGLPFMVNITLPDEKSNYVHRIGRVGRAERMGLAISLVSTVPEKVWYHGEWCSSRGRNCWNTRLTDESGCCIWYNEPRYLAEIEDHLNVTIQQVEQDLKVPMNEFDGKVVYGQKRHQLGSGYENHVEQMAPAVQELSQLESKAQLLYLRRHYGKEARNRF